MSTKSVPALSGWRPHDPHEWARQMMSLSLATRGALSFLADSLWISTAGPCAIENDEAEIATACGARVEWKQDARLREEILSVLAPHPSIPGMLTWTWLLRLWERQLEAHQARRRAGSKGGTRKRPALAMQQELPIDDEQHEQLHDALPEMSPPIEEPPLEVESHHVDEPKQCLAMLSNAPQSKSERELLFSAPRREKQFSSPPVREAEVRSGAPPAFVASDARGAPSLRVDPPPPINGCRTLDMARENAEREYERNREEREYYARRRRIPGAAPVAVATVDWRAGMVPRAEPPQLAAVG